MAAGESKVVRFLNNVENADKLRGLVEDIRDAMMDYQVCNHPNQILMPDIRFRLCYNKICTTRVANLL